MAWRHVFRITLGNSLHRAPLGGLKNGFHTSGTRCLFNSEALGLDNFTRQKAAASEKIGDMKEKVLSRIEEYMQSSATNTIFTDDLKSVIHIAESDEDLAVLEKMIARYREQSGELRFSSFVFGPLVMRTCHLLNKPDFAYELFIENDKPDGFFDQVSTFVVLMDLLFENGQYDRVLTLRKVVEDRQVAGIKFPSDCLTIFAAACCKMNTPESHAELLQVFDECFKKEMALQMRAIIYATYLSVKQNDAKTALELLSHIRGFESGKVPAAYTNMKALALVQAGRLEESLAELRQVLQVDDPEVRINNVFTEVVSRLKVAIENTNDKEMSHKVAELERALGEANHLNTQSFEEYLFMPIFKKRKLQDGYKSRRRSGAMGYSRDGGEQQTFRKGLSYGEEKIYT